MVYYLKREMPENYNGKQYEFAFSMAMANGKRGEQFLGFNTFQPSLSAKDQDNLVANWLQLTNLGECEGEGTLSFYEFSGEKLADIEVRIASGERRDFSAHQFGINKVGLAAWRPASREIPFQLRNVRYLYNNSQGLEMFDTAIQLESMYGSGGLLTSPLDTRGGSAVLELLNTSDKKNRVEVSIRSRAGEEKYKKVLTLAPHGTIHIIADDEDKLGADSLGLALVQGQHRGGLIAVSMHYVRKADGSIHSMYGIPAIAPAGTLLRSSYNSFLGHDSVLLLLNPRQKTESANLDIADSRGERSGGHEEGGIDFIVAPQALTEVPLSGYLKENEYGVLTLQLETPNSLIAWILRKRGTEYVIPTPARQ
jgi:hypothetical protein